MFFLYCLVLTSASAQSSWTYADTWVDAETNYNGTGQNGEVYVVGCGVAEIDTAALAHTVRMIVEVVSPQGRANYGSGYWTQQSFGTSMTVVVPLGFVWEPADEGDYFTNTSVQVTCPYEPGMSYGSISLPIRIALDDYELLSEIYVGGRFGHGVCDYDATCYGFCSLTRYNVDKLTPQNCPRYTQCRTLVVRGNCLQIAKACLGGATRGICN